MSDTPRTDAALIDIGHPLTEPNTVTADFARTLEREIAKLEHWNAALLRDYAELRDQMEMQRRWNSGRRNL